MKRVVQDVLDRSPRLQALTPPKTREVVQWCRQRGYTPPDPEPQRKNDDESIEDILTQIDNEPGELMCMIRCTASVRRYLLQLVFAISQSSLSVFSSSKWINTFPLSVACVGVVLLQLPFGPNTPMCLQFSSV